MQLTYKLTTLKQSKHLKTLLSLPQQVRETVGMHNIQLGISIFLVVTLASLCLSIVISANRPKPLPTIKHTFGQDVQSRDQIALQAHSLSQEPPHASSRNLSATTARPHTTSNSKAISTSEQANGQTGGYELVSDRDKTLQSAEHAMRMKTLKGAFRKKTASSNLINDIYNQTTDPLQRARLDALVVNRADVQSPAFAKGFRNITENITNDDPEIRETALKSYIDNAFDGSNQNLLDFVYESYEQETNDQVKQMLIQELAFSGDQEALRFVKTQAENESNSSELKEASWIAIANSADYDTDL